MQQIQNRLSDFKSTSLEKMDSVKLMNRQDTKFIFSRNKLLPLFDCLIPHYDVLEIDQRRILDYESLYLDTDDYRFYHQHHSKKMNRYKLRYRNYLNSGLCFFEVKFKSNKSRTIKNRVKNDEIKTELSKKNKLFASGYLSKNNHVDVESVEPKLWIRFSRITLVDQINKERITIDLDLSFKRDNCDYEIIDKLVVAELKQEKLSTNSQFAKSLRYNRIYSTGFSKYCIGTALLNNNVKSNRFKSRLLTLEKLN